MPQLCPHCCKMGVAKYSKRVDVATGILIPHRSPHSRVQVFDSVCSSMQDRTFIFVDAFLHQCAHGVEIEGFCDMRIGHTLQKPLRFCAERTPCDEDDS